MDRIGQTRAGRVGDASPGAGAGSHLPSASNPRAFIEQTVRSSPAAVFSKQICPSCRKAKQIMNAHLPGRFAVIELDQRGDGEELQDTLEQMTGKHSVPSIWIGGQFVGGADDLDELENSGQLDQRLRAAAAS